MRARLSLNATPDPIVAAARAMAVTPGKSDVKDANR
jgi:hypothetical protein